MKKSNKYWRYSSIDEFYIDALSYLDKEIKRIEETLYNFNTMTRLGLKENITIYNRIRNNKFYDYDTKEILELGCKIVKRDVNDWARFSNAYDSSINDITIRVILGNLFNFNYVSICTLSHNKLLTEDFIKDLLYMTSGYFSFDEWDDDHVDAILDCIKNNQAPIYNDKMKKLYSKERLSKKKIPVKFDFYNSYNYTEEFTKEYHVLFDNLSTSII